MGRRRTDALPYNVVLSGGGGGGGAPSGGAGGDLGGSYPNPTVTDLTITSEARGDLLMRGASSWGRLAPGTSGYALLSAGAGADLVWGAVLLGSSIGTTVQAYDADLDALAAVSSTGLLARTGSGTAAARTLTAGSGQLTVTNGNGVSGNPTVDLAYASAVRESSGPTTLTVGAVADGQALVRSGSTLVGLTLGAMVVFAGVIDSVTIVDGPTATTATIGGP